MNHSDIVRRGYAAFNTADMATLMELFDEHATWHSPGHSLMAGDHVGREAVMAQFGRYGSLSGGTFQARLLHVLHNDDGLVVGIHHNSAERNGKRLDVGCCIVFQFKDGRVMDAREHSTISTPGTHSGPSPPAPAGSWAWSRPFG